MSDQAQETARRESSWGRWGWQALVWIIIAVLVFDFLAANRGPVRVIVFFLAWQVSLALWSLICVILGVATTMLIIWRRRRR